MHFLMWSSSQYYVLSTIIPSLQGKKLRFKSIDLLGQITQSGFEGMPVWL